MATLTEEQRRVKCVDCAFHVIAETIGIATAYANIHTSSMQHSTHFMIVSNF
jgi:hypothetical protein